VSKETKARIPCLPRIKVIDDGRLIGIMTETNQFVEIQPDIAEPLIPPAPAGVKSPELVAYNTTNPNAADAEVQSGSGGEDADRVKYVRHMQLETEMYELFRNSMRIMINSIKNMAQKKRIEDIVKDMNSTPANNHNRKIREIMRICREMSHQFVQFSAMSDAVLNAYISSHEFKTKSTEFMRCIAADKHGPKMCMRAVNPVGECSIIFPLKNLINGMDNRTFYYGKLADELLRYTRIRRFLLSSSSTFTLMPTPYDLHDNEIILLQSQLDHYFDHLEPGAGAINRFARYNTFATANPELNPGEVPSSNYVVGAAEIREESPPAASNVAARSNLCAPVVVKPLAGSTAHYFPKTMKLLTFENAMGECTFDAFISILKEESAQHDDITVRELKTILVSKYAELMRTHKVQMMNYYKHLTANRRVLATNVQDFIMNSFHYMTHLDLWILAQRFHIPIVLVAGQTHHPLVENQQSALVLHHAPDTDETNAVFYYVMTMGRYRDVAPTYSIIRTGENELKFSLSQCINAEFIAQIAPQLMVDVSVADFISEYVPVVKKRVGLKAAEEGEGEGEGDGEGEGEGEE
jgi:hypothetical protein